MNNALITKGIINMNNPVPITKYQLADVMRNHMHIPTSEAIEALETYHMVHMSGKHFALSLVDGTIAVTKNGNAMIYNIIYHGCNPFAAKRAIKLKLSFRSAKDEYNIEPIVLVGILEHAQVGE